MITVKEMLAGKGGSTVHSVEPNARVGDALRFMAEKNIGALIVIDKGNIVGIFSERDFARSAAGAEEKCTTAPVRAMMTAQVYYVMPGDTIDQCMALMTNKRVRHLPVLDNNVPIGMISIGDVVNAMISEQKKTIDQLERYIRGE
ncbi:MAG TPA: CBS domain-containing protein [Geobacteraceae bacterium]|nr:CBS domain-containing protein [Geobacteraceae bacterium]